MKHVLKDSYLKEFAKGPDRACTKVLWIFGGSCGGSCMVDNWSDDVRIWLS